MQSIHLPLSNFNIEKFLLPSYLARFLSICLPMASLLFAYLLSWLWSGIQYLAAYGFVAL